MRKHWLRLCLALPGAALALIGFMLGGVALAYLGATMILLALVPSGGKEKP